MKDKRLDALLQTLMGQKEQVPLKCAYYSTLHNGNCIMAKKEYGWDFHTNCQGDIRKCEREE